MNTNPHKPTLENICKALADLVERHRNAKTTGHGSLLVGGCVLISAFLLLVLI